MAKKRQWLPALLVVLCMPLAQAAENQALPEREVTLPRLLELVRQNSPALQAERVQVAMAEADLLTARTFSNPSVAYSRKRGEKEASISQALPLFGQRGSAIASAQSGVEAARAQLRASYAEVLRDAAHGFMSLWVAQQREQRWLDAQQDLESAMRIVRGQVEAGARSRYDLSRLEVERAALHAQLAQSQADTEQAAASVAALAGAPAWRPRAMGSIVPRAETLSFDEVWPGARQRLPSVRAATAMQEQAEKQWEAERRQAYPTPTVSVGQIDNRFDGRSTEVGVEVAIPLFDRNQGPIARAAAEADGMRLRARAVTLAAESELRRAVEQLNQRRQLAARFEREGLAMLPRLRQMAQDAYTLGEGSILDLVDAIQAVAEKKNTYLDLLEASLQAEIDLGVAAGELGADLIEQP